MEDWLIGLLEGKKIETQQRLYSEKWNISGRPDLVMDGRVYEIKPNTQGLSGICKGR